MELSAIDFNDEPMFYKRWEDLAMPDFSRAKKETIPECKYDYVKAVNKFGTYPDIHFKISKIKVP